MTRLSVNVNKIATIRNARGGNNPDLVHVVQDCEQFGAQGITIHPRPDERHITHQDVLDIKLIVTTEYNIEGYPDQRFMELVLSVKPDQATLVPDPPDALTSNAGWDTKKHKSLLNDVVKELSAAGIRTSLFVDTATMNIEGAKEVGSDRIELFTEPYASEYTKNREIAIKPYIQAAERATDLGLGINAGHDLDLKNLQFFVSSIPAIDEVSIGHALICDALYYGLENTIQLYLRQLI